MSGNFCSWGKFHITYIFPFLMGIAYCFRQLMNLLLKYHQDTKSIKGPGLGQHHFLYTTAIMFLGESLIMFLFLIVQNRASRKGIEHKNLIGIIPGHNFQEKLKLGLTVIPVFLMDVVLSTFSNYLISKESVSLDQLNKMILIIINIPLSSYFFNSTYYKHHYFGLIVTIIGLVIYTINSIISIKPEDKYGQPKNIWFEIIAALVTTASTAFHNIWEKKLMDKDYFNPYSLIGLQGIYGMIFSLIVLGILNCFKWDNPFFCDVDDKYVPIYDSCQSFKSLDRLFTSTNNIWIITVFYTIGFTLFNIFRMLTNQNFSTTHRCISDCFGAFLIWIFKLIIDNAYDKENNTYDIIFGSVSYPFIIFGVLVFLEFVILNFYDLNMNTNYMISHRGDEENPIYSMSYKFYGTKFHFFSEAACEIIEKDIELISD
jgi:hypothetical protein